MDLADPKFLNGKRILVKLPYDWLTQPSEYLESAEFSGSQTSVIVKHSAHDLAADYLALVIPGFLDIRTGSRDTLETMMRPHGVVISFHVLPRTRRKCSALQKIK